MSLKIKWEVSYRDVYIEISKCTHKNNDKSYCMKYLSVQDWFNYLINDFNVTYTHLNKINNWE